MHTRTVTSSHLGERRFREYPQFLPVDLATRLRTVRRTILALALALVGVAGAVLFLLR
jgi:hypothetical protein